MTTAQTVLGAYASIEERAAFAAGHGLRGVFTWQLAADDDEHTLLAAMTRPFHRPGASETPPARG
jgi:GH18 family chitinase